MNSVDLAPSAAHPAQSIHAAQPLRVLGPNVIVKAASSIVVPAAGERVVAEGIPVNNQENGWRKHCFRILGVVALMGGAALATLVPDGALPGVLIVVLGVFLLVANEVWTARRKAAKRWVVDTGSGFRWLGGPRRWRCRTAGWLPCGSSGRRSFRRHSQGRRPPFRGMDCRQRPADVHDQSTCRQRCRSLGHPDCPCG